MSRPQRNQAKQNRTARVPMNNVTSKAPMQRPRAKTEPTHHLILSPSSFPPTPEAPDKIPIAKLKAFILPVSAGQTASLPQPSIPLSSRARGAAKHSSCAPHHTRRHHCPRRPKSANSSHSSAVAPASPRESAGSPHQSPQPSPAP